MRLFQIDDIRKSLQKIFFTENIAFFFKILCFQQFPRCYRNELITSTVIVGTPFLPLQNVHWCLTHSILRERRATKIYSLECSLFFKNLCFQQPLTSWKKCCHKFHSKSRNSLWSTIKCFLRLVTFDNTKKMGQNFLSSWKISFEIIGYIDFLGPKEMILLLPQ